MIEAIPILLTPPETVSYLGYVLSCQEFEEFRNPTTRLTIKLNKETAQLQTANGNKLNLERILIQVEHFLNIVAELHITCPPTNSQNNRAPRNTTESKQY